MSDNETHGTDGRDVPMKDENNTAGTSSEITASSRTISLPTFWTNTPGVWFITAEVQFSLAKISKDSEKFGHTVKALSPEAATAVLDLLQNPPLVNKYETLKAALIERNSPSEERKLETLLDRQDLGDRRPSEVLRHIKILAGNNFTPTLIKALWIRKMPEYIRIALLAQDENATTDDLSKIADKLYEALSGTQSINLVQRQSRPTVRQQYRRQDLAQEENSSSTSVTSLENRIERMEKMLAKLTSRNRSQSQSRRFD